MLVTYGRIQCSCPSRTLPFRRIVVCWMVLQLYLIGDDLTTPLNVPLSAALSSNRLIRTVCEKLCSRICLYVKLVAVIIAILT